MGETHFDVIVIGAGLAQMIVDEDRGVIVGRTLVSQAKSYGL